MFYTKLLSIFFVYLILSAPNARSNSRMFEGAYGGVNLGINCLNATANFTSNNPNASQGSTNIGGIGGVLGGILGYRWMFREVSFGFELNAQWLGNNASVGGNNNANNSAPNSMQINRSTGVGAAALLGMFLNHHVVLFLKGGLEEGSTKMSMQALPNLPGIQSTQKNLNYKVGLGLEAQFADCMSVRTCFDYVMSSKAIGAGGSNGGGNINSTAKPTVLVFTLAFIYNFH